MSDDGLRRRFLALKQRDTAAAPPFARVWDRAVARAAQPARRPWAGLGLAGAVLAVTAVALILMVESKPKPVVDLAGWRSPTAFLLQSPTPAREILSTLPRIGLPNSRTNQ